MALDATSAAFADEVAVMVSVFVPVAPLVGVTVTHRLAVLIGASDDVSSPSACRQMVDGARGRSALARIVIYPGAAHDFDRADLPRIFDPYFTTKRGGNTYHGNAFYDFNNDGTFDNVTERLAAPRTIATGSGTVTGTSASAAIVAGSAALVAIFVLLLVSEAIQRRMVA